MVMFYRGKMSNSLFILLIVCCSSAFADELEPTIGFEPTLTRQDLLEAGEKGDWKFHDDLIDKLYETFKRHQNPDFRLEKLTKHHFKVIWPEFEVLVKLDLGVVELNTPGLTEAGWKKHYKKMDVIFKIASSINLRPHYFQGEGHASIEFQSGFRSSQKFLAKFVADYANHRELLLGILGRSNETTSSHPMDHPEKWQKLSNILTSIQTGALKFTDFSHVNLARLSLAKTGFISLLSLIRDKVKEPFERVELRGLRPQRNGKEMYLIAKLLTRRIRFLDRHNGIITLKRHTFTSYTHFIASFYTYLKESKLHKYFRDFRRLMEQSLQYVKLDKELAKEYEIHHNETHLQTGGCDRNQTGVSSAMMN